MLFGILLIRIIIRGCCAGFRWPHMRDYKGNMVFSYKSFSFFLATTSPMLKQSGYEVAANRENLPTDELVRLKTTVVCVSSNCR